MAEHQRKPFESDGCTLAPDLWFTECCIAHDLAYFQGGTPADRKDADDKLYRCLREHHTIILAWVYWAAVRAMGHKFWPAPVKPEGWNWAGPVKRA